jgi:hypothetical protein
MPVEHGTYCINIDDQDDALIDEDTLSEHVADMNVNGGTMMHNAGRAALIIDIDKSESETLQRVSIDAEPARVRIYDTEIVDGKLHYTDMRFNSLNQARLAYGLWIEYGPFAEPESSAIPVDVAVGGQEAIAAYLRVNGGHMNSRSYVAERMGVTEGTVSNYCNRVRWTPVSDSKPDIYE